MLWLFAGLSFGMAIGFSLAAFVVRSVKPDLVLELPKPQVPKKRLKPGVYQPTNAAHVKKALRMGGDDVLE